MGRIQGLKTAKVVIGSEVCVVDELLRDRGLMQATANQTQREQAVVRVEDQTAVTLYLMFMVTLDVICFV